MQQITIAGQIQLPKDAIAREEAIDRARDALRELSGLIIHQAEGDNWASYTPFQSIQLTDAGELKMTIISRTPQSQKA